MAEKELIMEMRGSDWDLIAEILYLVEEDSCFATRAHEISETLHNISKKNLLGDVCRCMLAIKLSYE